MRGRRAGIFWPSESQGAQRLALVPVSGRFIRLVGRIRSRGRYIMSWVRHQNPEACSRLPGRRRPGPSWGRPGRAPATGHREFRAPALWVVRPTLWGGTCGAAARELPRARAQFDPRAGRLKRQKAGPTQTHWQPGTYPRGLVSERGHCPIGHKAKCTRPKRWQTA